MHLDKDILVKGNKVYSRDNCIFVPSRINLIFKGKFNGISEINDKFRVRFNINGKLESFGTYDTIEQAFLVYKHEKEKYIKEVIDSYEGKIPEPHYSKLRDAMYEYEVEIDD